MAIQRVDPFDCQMPFPLDLRGQKQDLNARNAIPLNSRWLGMEVFVVSEGVKYILMGTTGDSGWTPTGASGGTTGTQIVTVNTAAPVNSTGVNGDMWFRAITGGTQVYQKTSGVWVSKGVIPASGAPLQSLIISTVDVSIAWQTDIANDLNGTPTGMTYAERFGNTIPAIQVSKEETTGVYTVNADAVITAAKTGSLITTVSIALLGVKSEIVIK